MYKGKIICESLKAPQDIQVNIKTFPTAIESILKALAAQMADLPSWMYGFGQRLRILAYSFRIELPAERLYDMDHIKKRHTLPKIQSLSNVNDILDKLEQVNQTLAMREAELTQLRGIEQMILSSLDLHEVLKRILNGALDLIGAEYGQVVLAGKYASGLVRQVSFPNVLGSFSEMKLGITQSIMEDKRSKLINNATSIGHYGTHAYMMKSLLGVPILLEDELIGVINIASQDVDVFDEQSLDMLKQLAVQAAIAIKNAYQFKAEREMREQLVNMAQVVAMSDMASNMVHNINNEVGSIKADINYLKRQNTLGKLTQAELVELLDDMLKNAESTLAMAENILMPFQVSAQEAIDVNECISNVLQQKKDDLSKIVVLEQLGDLPLVMATRQLELVFENLIDNALLAMNDQATRVLQFVSRCSNDRKWVEVTIKDTGPGLLKNLNEDDIFKLGVSGRQDGLGYGLWWCDTFLKRWGGQIQYVKNSKRGCDFLVRLPAATIAARSQVGGLDI